ncbi:MAG: D-glycerate dehydrogenase [Candidatus Helarchaeota archaeon]|nr:D-glycerate dehydrogenase [Candidatus Helarchaeota archaeon]
MHEKRVYVTRSIPGTGLDRLSVIANVNVHPGPGPPSHKTLLKNVRDCDGLLTMLSDKITPEVIDAAGPNMRIISNYAVGFNNIDVEYATQKSIIIAHTPDVLTESTADLAWALLLTTARRVVEGDQLTRSEQWTGWEPTFMLGTDVHRKIIGIIGLGRIGLAVAKRALAFNMKVLYFSRTRKLNIESRLGIEYKPLGDLLAESDFVSIHVPLTSETEKMLGTDQLNLMKSNAILINTARGGIVDERALVQALKSQIKGAGLDVYQEEPTRNRELFKLPNVVLTPHLGSATLETRVKMADLAVDNLIYGLNKKYDKIKVANPSVLSSF